ncbi:hypothetical protein BBD42_10655 [Paenibacillus sp. BIHB 4019]|uniref:Uncharacterized protein n=1 Tax=Paenibacillus sp. BIHB 4019 TaxID=1870819 RepID=A0A1B2DGQ0_9BACL|nr:hypothetical protein BBD42_10655 [Paenibacillus sp. BIHB 4019]
MRRAILLSLIFSLIGNTLYYATAYSVTVLNGVITLLVLIGVLYTIAIVRSFSGRYWYFPLFIPVLWVPLTVILTYGLGLLFPLSDEATSRGLLVIYIHGLNLCTVAASAFMGMFVKGLLYILGRMNKE